jgi:hypothetical protein
MFIHWPAHPWARLVDVSTATWGLGLISLVCGGLGVPAQTNSAGQADPLAGTKAIEGEFRKLDETPIGKQLAEIHRKFDAMTAQVGKARDEMEAQYLQIERTEAYKDFQKRRQALEEKRDTEWSRERKAMTEAARKLYAARHAELRQLAAQATPQARELGLDVLTFPRLDGSTSTHPLSVILASRVLGAPYEWIYPEPTGSPWWPRPKLPEELFLFDEYDYYPSREKMEFSFAASRVVAKPFRASQARLAIMINSLLAISTSTHNAFTNLIEGKCDLNLTARAPSADELAITMNISWP